MKKLNPLEQAQRKEIARIKLELARLKKIEQGQQIKLDYYKVLHEQLEEVHGVDMEAVRRGWKGRGGDSLE